MTSSPVRLLLVEDDSVSAAFMAGALSALPVEVRTAASLEAARIALRADRFDLCLIDAHLPDGEGASLLDALPGGTAALAHTAAREKALLDALIARGFEEVLVKPLSAADLQGAVRRHVPGMAAPGPAAPLTGKQPVWDDDAASRALGGTQHVGALRTLFLAELPASRDAVVAAAQAQDYDALKDPLHRLTASCGFVGATRLAAAVEMLGMGPGDPSALQGFVDAVDDTLIAANADATRATSGESAG